MVTTSNNESKNKEKQIIPVSSLWGLVKGNVDQIQFCEALCPRLRMQTPKRKSDNANVTGYYLNIHGYQMLTIPILHYGTSKCVF